MQRKNATVCSADVHTVSPIRIIRECTSNERTGKHYIYVWHNKGMYGTSFLLVYTPTHHLLYMCGSQGAVFAGQKQAEQVN